MNSDKRFHGFFAIIISIIILSALAIGVPAQRVDQSPVPSVASSSAPTARKMPEVKQPLPFGEGEVMKFEVKFARFPIYASVGEMTFTITEEKGPVENTGKANPESVKVEKPATDQPTKTDQQNTTKDVEKIRIHAEAISKGALLSLFGVKVRDQFDSVLDKKDLGTYTCKVNVEEGKRRREQTTVIERDKRQITYTERNLNSQTEEPKVVKSEFKDWPLIFDPVGAMFYVRSQELKIGQSVKIPISDNGKPSEVEIIPVLKEDLKIEGEQYHAVKLDARVFDGALFNGKGEMFIWLTDDKYRMPIKFQVKAKYGTVTGNLISKTYAGSNPPADKTPGKPVSKQP